MIKAEPFNGVQGVNSVSKRDELHPNQGVVSSTVVNVPFSFQASTDEGGEQRTGTELDNVVVVQKQIEDVVPSSYSEMRCKEILELNKGNGVQIDANNSYERDSLYIFPGSLQDVRKYVRNT